MLTLKQADRLAVQFKEKLQALSTDELARQSRFVRRKPRKITPLNFLIVFFIVVLTGANALSALATTIGLLCGCRVSKQAVDKRIKAPVIKFLELVLAATLSTVAKDKNASAYPAVSKAFKRVLVQDSTNIQLDAKLAPYFPGSRNHKKTRTAILKIQSVIDLLSERFCHFVIAAFTHNDQKASPLILQLVQHRDRRLNPSKEHLALLGWEIFITNVDRDVFTAEQIADIYELRWRIEIVFKSWKSHFSLTNVPKASATRVLAYIYAMLIFIAMFQTYVYARLYRAYYQKNSHQLSLLKLARFFKEQIWAVTLFFQTLEEMTPQKLIEQIFYHCVYELRKDRLNYTEKVAALG
jgi:hypothetical protein